MTVRCRVFSGPDRHEVDRLLLRFNSIPYEGGASRLFFWSEHTGSVPIVQRP